MVGGVVRRRADPCAWVVVHCVGCFCLLRWPRVHRELSGWVAQLLKHKARASPACVWGCSSPEEREGCSWFSALGAIRSLGGNRAPQSAGLMCCLKCRSFRGCLPRIPLLRCSAPPPPSRNCRGSWEQRRKEEIPGKDPGISPLVGGEVLRVGIGRWSFWVARCWFAKGYFKSQGLKYISKLCLGAKNMCKGKKLRASFGSWRVLYGTQSKLLKEGKLDICCCLTQLLLEKGNQTGWDSSLGSTTALPDQQEKRMERGTKNKAT